MNVSFGFKAHSGWAALVAIGKGDDDFVVVDRRRLELVSEAWAKQPYHAAEGLDLEAARKLVTRGIDQVQRVATCQLQTAIERERSRQNDVTSCAVLVSEPMRNWTIADILAVHFRMHKAEGELFRVALVEAAENCGLRVVKVAEKSLLKYGNRAGPDLQQLISRLGKAAGPPWAKDQKQAATAALIALSK